jgi:hypothetical protein
MYKINWFSTRTTIFTQKVLTRAKNKTQFTVFQPYSSILLGVFFHSHQKKCNRNRNFLRLGCAGRPTPPPPAPPCGRRRVGEDGIFCVYLWSN